MKLQAPQLLEFAAISDGVSYTGTKIDGYAIATSFNSRAFFVGQALGYCLVVSCPATGSPVGTVKVQGCVDDVANHGSFQADDVSLVNWFDLGFVNPTTGAIVTTQSISTTVPVIFEETSGMYRWFRLVYTRSSGTITVTAKVQFKGIN